MEEERTVIIMDDQTFHFKAKENLNNDMNMIELLTTQAKETNNSIYWYLLFKHVNNYYIDFNHNNAFVTYKASAKFSRGFRLSVDLIIIC